MTGRDFEHAIYAAATEAVEIATDFDGAEAQMLAMGIIDGARLAGHRIENPDVAAVTVMRAVQASTVRLEAVGL